MHDAAARKPLEPDTTDALLLEVDARRHRLSENLDELGERLQPANLLAEVVDIGRDTVVTEYNRLRDQFLDLGADMIEDTIAWTTSHKRWIIGGSAAALVVAAGIALATRRRTVPLYAAYDMEDPKMMNEHDPIDDAATKAARAWDKVKDSADELGHTVKDKAGEYGNKAGEAYYAARSKANELADAARDRAAHAAEVARERAHEAAEAAREAADRAREAAGEAGQWAKRQPQENPMTVVIVALAVGAIVGALITSERRRDA